MNQRLEQIFYHFILSNPKLLAITKASFFSNQFLKIAYQYAHQFAIDYKTAPTMDQLNEVIALDSRSEDLPPNIVKSIYDAKTEMSNYTDEWLEENIVAWARWTNLVLSLRKTINYVKTVEGDIKVENAKEETEKIKNLFSQDSIITYDDNPGLDFFNPNQHQMTRIAKHTTGYDFIDKCAAGGYWLGSLWVFLGAPKSGKSTVLQNLCAQSVRNSNNCAFITLELQEEIVVQRMGANLLNIETQKYEEFSKDPIRVRDRLSELKQHAMRPLGALIIKEFPASSASVYDIENFLLSKEAELSTANHQFKFRDVFIDYINIMRNWRNSNSDNTYNKIKQIAEDVRAMAQRNGWCIISASQTRRDQIDSSDIGAKDTSESVALNATVDMLFGIIKDPIMNAMDEIVLKCIYTRVTDMSEYKRRFRNNKPYMRIEEDISEPITNEAISGYSTFNNRLHKIKRDEEMQNQSGEINIISPPQSTIPAQHDNTQSTIRDSEKPTVDLATTEAIKGYGLFN